MVWRLSNCWSFFARPRPDQRPRPVAARQLQPEGRGSAPEPMANPAASIPVFFRIPLWRPDAFLNRAWPWLERFGPRALRYGLPATLGLGVFLVSRDWQRFIATFPHLFSLGGALAFGVALFFSPSFATSSATPSWPSAPVVGCRAWAWRSWCCCRCFYTDVSDAWRVNDRRARLLIGAGGVLAELVLACIALLAWSLLPDGPGRTAAFMLASATWITTLVINLNPFMRFDGYFLLSDFWEVDNLQGRAFALCRWRLREFFCLVTLRRRRSRGRQRCSGVC